MLLDIASKDLKKMDEELYLICDNETVEFHDPPSLYLKFKVQFSFSTYCSVTII